MTGFRLGCGGKKEKLSPSGLTKPTALVDEVSAPRGFGIRSYLHQFYLSPTVEDIEQSGAWYLLPPPPAQRRGLFLCRVCTVIGLFLLVAGAVLIVIGHSWPHEGVEASITRIVIYEDEDGGYYVPEDRLQQLLLDPMRHWKTAGLCVFALGALILAVSLIIPTAAACLGSQLLAGFMSEDNTPNEPPVRIYPTEKSTVSTSSGPVPVMEAIAKVQPNEKKEVSADLLGDDDTQQ